MGASTLSWPSCASSTCSRTFVSPPATSWARRRGPFCCSSVAERPRSTPSHSCVILVSDDAEVSSFTGSGVLYLRFRGGYGRLSFRRRRRSIRQIFAVQEAQHLHARALVH